jgi:Holliday junction resolvase RusA-like endonuclease
MIQLPSDRITLRVPIPVSTNNLQRSTRTGRRFNSPKYTDWKQEAGLEIIRQRPGLSVKALPAKSGFGFAIALPELDAGDVDNRAKACLDLMHRMGVCPDDKWCRVTISGIGAGIPVGWAMASVWVMAAGEVWL